MAKDFDLAAVMADIEASPFDWTAGETALTRIEPIAHLLRGA